MMVRPQTKGNAKWEKAIDYSDVTNDNQNRESRKIVNSEKKLLFYFSIVKTE